MTDKVAVEVVQRAFVDSGYTVADAAELCGYSSKTDFERAIGLMPYTTRRGEPGMVTRLTYAKAGRIVAKLNLWPIDYDV